MVGDGAALAELLADTRINALCMGPGMGRGMGMGISDETRALIAQGLKSGRALVLDADALTLIARDPALFAALHGACVLPPPRGRVCAAVPGYRREAGRPGHHRPGLFQG